MTGAPPPPPGFIPYDPTASAAPVPQSAPPPPPGFVPYEPAQAPAQPKKTAADIPDLTDPSSPLYGQRHGGSIVTGTIDAAKDAFLLPGDVATGKTDPTTHEGVGRVLDAAMLFSPVTPGMLGKAAIPAATPRAAEPAAAGSVLDAAERIGVQVPRAVASDSAAVQALGAGVRNVPFAGAPLEKAAGNTLRQLGESAEGVATGFSGATRAEAGASAREAIEVGWRGRTAAMQDRLYGKVDSLVDPRALTKLENTQGVVADLLAKQAESKISDPGKAVSFVQDAIQDPAGLTYEGIKGLRTRLGEMLKNPQALANAGVSERELRAVYGGLSEDLRASVTASGGDKARSAFEAANAYSAAVKSRADRLQAIVGVKGDEAVFDRLVKAASSRGGADISLLAQARRAIGGDAWDDVAGAVVARLGRDAEGSFTPLRYITDIGKLSPEGRAILFNSTGKADLARSLSDIAIVSSRFKELQKYANPSGTGRQVGFSAGGAGLIVEPVTTATTILGANVMARILAQPASASSFAKWSTAYERVFAKPGPAAEAAFAQATKNLSSTIGGPAGQALTREAVWQEIRKGVQGDPGQGR